MFGPIPSTCLAQFPVHVWCNSLYMFGQNSQYMFGPNSLYMFGLIPSTCLVQFLVHVWSKFLVYVWSRKTTEVRWDKDSESLSLYFETVLTLKCRTPWLMILPHQLLWSPNQFEPIRSTNPFNQSVQPIPLTNPFSQSLQPIPSTNPFNKSLQPIRSTNPFN